MIPPGDDCGHHCCDEPFNPFHDHFLDYDDCPSCQRIAAEIAVTEATLRAAYKTASERKDQAP